MPTLRDMLNANQVFIKLAVNPNISVTTAFSLLPILRFLTDVEETYLKHKQEIIDKDTTLDEKEQEFNELLGDDIECPEIVVTVKSLKGCNLTMIDLDHIHWWLVDRLPDEEFED